MTEGAPQGLQLGSPYVRQPGAGRPRPNGSYGSSHLQQGQPTNVIVTLTSSSSRKIPGPSRHPTCPTLSPAASTSVRRATDWKSRSSLSYCRTCIHRAVRMYGKVDCVRHAGVQN